MANTTNYSWETPDDTDLVKDGAAAIRTLGSSIDTTTKALNPETTLGDLAYRSSSANVKTRLGIGSTGNVLTVAGGVPTWAAPAAGSLTLLSTTATTSGNSITITGIDQTYKALKIVGQDINRAGTADIRIYPRNSTTDLACTGTLNYHTNQTEIYPYDAIYGTNNNGQITNAYPMYFVWDIFDYASSSREKNFELNGGFSRQSLSPERYVGWNVYGVINSTSAINALNFYSDQAFNSGQILVYGVN